MIKFIRINKAQNFLSLVQNKIFFINAKQKE